MHIVIQLHFHRYPNALIQVGFVKTLLLGTTSMWFAPLLECQSPSLNHFETFVEQFSAIFGDSNIECTTINKLRSLHQGPHLTIVYSYEFKHLTCDISWNEVALISQFQFGLHNDVKDSLLTMLIPTRLNQTLPKLFNVIISILNDVRKSIGNCHHSKNNSWPSHHPHRWCLHQRMIPCESIKHDSNHSWNKKNNDDIYITGN